MKNKNTKELLENGGIFTPKFNKDGLISAIAIDHNTGEVLMLAFMNEESLEKTLKTGEVWYFSRSRQELWRKGATSGYTQKLIEILVDCDQDAILLKVEQQGPACHTGKKSCFYRRVTKKKSDGNWELEVKSE